MIVPNGSGANSIPTSSGATIESVRFPVSNSIHVSDVWFLRSPRVSPENAAARSRSRVGTATKSVRCTSIIRRVPPVEHEAVPVGIGERRHVADAGVECLVDELDAAALELRARLGDVCDAQGDRRAMPVLELPADRRR